MIDPRLRIVTKAESRTNLAYARKRIKQVLNAALKVGDQWPPENEVVPMGRIQLARTIIQPDNTGYNIVFESNRSAAPHLRVRINGLPIDSTSTKAMTISMLETAYAILGMPEAENNITPFAEDVLDLAAFYHSTNEQSALLTLCPNALRHKISLRNTVLTRIDEATKMAIASSNQQLEKLTDTVRDRLPLLAKCAITESGGAFYVGILPVENFRKYPKTQNSMGNLPPLDPVRAIHLIREFQAELVASGHIDG